MATGGLSCYTRAAAPFAFRGNRQRKDLAVPIRSELLEIIRCPVSKQPLQMLSGEQLTKLNQSISAGSVRTTAGAQVEKAIDEGLITADAQTIYRVDDGIPVLLAEEGIPAAQLGN